MRSRQRPAPAVPQRAPLARALGRTADRPDPSKYYLQLPHCKKRLRERLKPKRKHSIPKRSAANRAEEGERAIRRRSARLRMPLNARVARSIPLVRSPRSSPFALSPGSAAFNQEKSVERKAKQNLNYTHCRKLQFASQHFASPRPSPSRSPSPSVSRCRDSDYFYLNGFHSFRPFDSVANEEQATRVRVHWRRYCLLSQRPEPIRRSVHYRKWPRASELERLTKHSRRHTNGKLLAEVDGKRPSRDRKKFEEKKSRNIFRSEANAELGCP